MAASRSQRYNAGVSRGCGSRENESSAAEYKASKTEVHVWTSYGIAEPVSTIDSAMDLLTGLLSSFASPTLRSRAVGVTGTIYSRDERHQIRTSRFRPLEKTYQTVHKDILHMG